MSKGPYSFKKSDIDRAVAAANKSVKPRTVEIDLERKCIRLIPVTPGEAGNDTDSNPWDAEIKKMSNS